MTIDKMGHILLVDDQDNWHDQLEEFLDGFQISHAYNLQEAKKILAQQKFDLAILDVTLIDEEEFNVEGLSLIQVIKRKNPNTAIIILTGYPQRLIEKPTKVAAFISKGTNFNVMEFRNLVEQLIKSKTNK
jgi:DNA-binding NtrC family response regulator